jgi:hypothetical protein
MFGISQSMKRWGVFCGTFFGPEDEWASDPDIAIQERESIEQFFSSGWNIHKFEEEKCERPTAAGAMKKWHIFHVIASRIDTV